MNPVAVQQKTLAVRNSAVKNLGKYVRTVGSLKPICIGNVMEIVKIGKKRGEMLQFAKIAKVFSLPMFLTAVMS